MNERIEVRTGARAYLILSLGTHDTGRTIWHRLVVWNSDSLIHRNIRSCGAR